MVVCGGRSGVVAVVMYFCPASTKREKNKTLFFPQLCLLGEPFAAQNFKLPVARGYNHDDGTS